MVMRANDDNMVGLEEEKRQLQNIDLIRGQRLQFRFPFWHFEIDLKYTYPIFF